MIYFDRVRSFFSDHSRELLLLFLFFFFSRVFFFSSNSTVWWDEAEHLSLVKRIVSGTPPVFWEGRSPFFALTLSVLSVPGYNEFLSRFTFLLYDLGCVFLCYGLFSKLFSRKVGFYSSLLFSFQWSHLFYSFRILSSVPALFFGLLSSYLFYSGVSESDRSYVLLSGVFLALTFYTRYLSGLVLGLSFLLFVLFSRFRDRFVSYFWILSGFIGCLPFLFFDLFLFGNPFFRQLEFLRVNVVGGAGRFAGSSFYYIFNSLNFFGFLWLIALLVGLFVLFSRFGSVRNRFVLIVFFVFFLFLSFGTSVKSDRYLMDIYPYFSLFGVVGVSSVVGSLDFDFKRFVLPCFVGFLCFSNFYNASFLIRSSADSYFPVKDSSLWIREFSDVFDVVVSVSRPQVAYYSERRVLHFPESFEDLESLVSVRGFRYLVVSVFEPHPDFAYNLSVPGLVPVKVYSDGGSPLLIVYELV